MNTEEFLTRMERFYELSRKICEKKVKDYCSVDDAFKNFRACETIGLCSVSQGIAVRMSDKLTRIGNLLEKKPDVIDESIEDSLMDLANYAAILYLWLTKNEELK